MPKEFSSEQVIWAALIVFGFILLMAMVVTTHRTSMACIEAGKTPSHSVGYRCRF